MASPTFGWRNLCKQATQVQPRERAGRPFSPSGDDAARSSLSAHPPSVGRLVQGGSGGLTPEGIAERVRGLRRRFFLTVLQNMADHQIVLAEAVDTYPPQVQWAPAASWLFSALPFAQPSGWFAYSRRGDTRDSTR
jgi:hypothetical protein